MARIRSIKPDFWKDGRIARLSGNCALFFIGLWNFCDDEGKYRMDSRELSLMMPLFRSQDIVKYVSRLVEVGLVQTSVNREWIVVVNWNHQKIDKPRVPSVLKSEIEWLPVLREDISTNATRAIGERSTTIRRKDRIGKEGKGEDRIWHGGVAFAPAMKNGNRVAGSAQIDLIEPLGEVLKSGSETAGEGGSSVSRSIAKFKALWTERHNGDYPLGGKDIGLIKGFVKSLGEHRTSEIFEAYFKMPDAWVVGRKHDVTTLNSNLAKVAAFADTGEFTTQTQVRQMDRTAAAASQLERIRRGEV